MNFPILTGGVITHVLYNVVGSIVYNGLTVSNTNFRGVSGVNSFTGTGTVTEILELMSGAVEYSENLIDQPIYPDTTKLTEMSVEVSLNPDEEIVIETTKITGMAVELIDYPFYSFEITETRL